MTGSVLDGRYRLIAPLASGGMSVVWRGHDDVLARPVAVKVIKVDAGDATVAARIRREAMAVARLNHPHIATVYDYGDHRCATGRMPYLVMELVDGEDLGQVLRRTTLTWPTAVGIAAQVAAALAAAHAGGVVHRDITPGNVMLCADGVKVIDFGIAAITGDGPDGEIFGTPAYLAPERLTGGPAQPATDVYGLGLLLYQMLTGHLPWSAATATQMLAAHRYVAPAPLPPLRGLPAEVADLCHRSLAVDPTARPTSAEIFAGLAAAARLGDRRSRGLSPSSAPPPRPPCGVPAPSATRVMPHGLASLPDTGAVTVRLRAARPARPRPIFVLPTILLAILMGCLGLSELRPGDSGVAAAPTKPTLIKPSLTTPAPATPPAGAPATRSPATQTPAAKAPATQTPGTAPKMPAVIAAPQPARRPHAVAPPAPGACHVDYRVTAQWTAGFTVRLTVANSGQAQVAGWTLGFDLGTGQALGAGWNGRWEQHGRTVTVHGTPFNQALPPGGEMTLGFVGTLDGHPASTPTRFTLNGTVCG